MIQETTIRESGLDIILENRLKELKEEFKSETVPFSFVFHRLCSSFTIKKKDCWELLYFLRNKGIIEIIAFHGIRINLDLSP